jgi:formamidopyrimidine-DNA glycosylase
MPELPEVEITARLLDAELAGAEIESAFAPGLNAVKTFDPPLDSLAGSRLRRIGRRGKLFVLEFEGAASWVGLIHLMSAGRLQLWDKRASLRDRTARLLFRLEDGRELRLREFGTRQRAWLRLVGAEGWQADPEVEKLGPEAWPDPPSFGEGLVAAPRPLHTLLRDQRVIAGIGRSWVDEILWRARLSPFKRGADLSAEEADRLREMTVATLGEAIDHYERELSLPLPDKLPMPLQVHRRQGEPCPRCGAELAAVHFEDYVIAYCPAEQTGGRLLKDRRMSRLLR